MCILVVGLFVLGFWGGLTSAENAIPVQKSSPVVQPRAYTTHAPIWIIGNSQFTLANGVKNPGATGDSTDPYIIEGWDIFANNSHGIWIENTNYYFIIRNCNIHDAAPTSKSGIRLSNVNNGSIIGNILLNNSFSSITLDISKNNSIENNTIISNGGLYNIYVSCSDLNNITNNNISKGNYGMYLENVKSNVIQGNYIHNNSDTGIYISHSNNNNISHNTILSNNNLGIFLSHSDMTIILHNNVTLHDIGIYLYNSNESGIFYNFVSNNGVGAMVLFSAINRIFYNNFVNNTVTGKQGSDNTGFNFWNATYPSGGNYWSGWTSPDVKSGPNQDYPGGRDGIVDSPYLIDGSAGAIDCYPLVTPMDFSHKELKVTLFAPFEASSGMIVDITAYVEDNLTFLPAAGVLVAFVPSDLLFNQTIFTDANGNATISYDIPAASSGTGYDVYCTIFVNASMPGSKNGTSSVVILLHIDGPPPPPVPESPPPALALVLLIILPIVVAVRRRKNQNR
jgi:parallel beta-helix repeat protein